MARSVRWLLGVSLFLFIVGGPFAYAKYRKASMRNFRAVEDGVLYRSGQLSLDGLKRVRHDHGIRTVITLRAGKADAEESPDAAEQDYCHGQEISYHRLAYRELSADGSPWLRVNGQAPIDDLVARFLAIMDQPKNHPALIHCFAGKNRTGAFVAIYRMEYQRWTSAAAIEELRAAGYPEIDEHADLLTYLQTYRPRWAR